MKSLNATTRDSALYSLTAGGHAGSVDPATVAVLKNALRDPSLVVRRHAAWVVGHLGIKGMAGQILELLQHDPEGAGDYMRGLGLQADPIALPTLIRYATDPGLGPTAFNAMRDAPPPTRTAQFTIGKSIDLRMANFRKALFAPAGGAGT
jgi:hypothetical protein